MAFYTFTDKAVGEHLTSVAGEVANAVNESFGGRGFSASAYGFCAPGVTSEKPYVSDDLPGGYLYANANAVDPLYGPGEWCSLVFPDHAAGYVLEDGELVFQPLVTNTASKLVSVVYRDVNGSARPQSGATVAFAGLDKALGEEPEWTMEFFLKQDSAYGGQQVLEMKTYAGLELYSIFSCWYQQAAYYRSAADGTTLPGRIYNSSDTSVNFAECGWRHVALVRTGTSIKYYFDYKLRGTEMAFPQRDPSAAPIAKYNTERNDDLILGDYRTSYPGNPLYGRIAGLRVTRRALGVDDFLVTRKTRDVLVIDGDYEVSASGESYSAVNIMGTARITGGPLQIESAISVMGGTATFANAGVELIDISSCHINLAAGTTLRLDTVVSGDAPEIALKGAGTAYFTQSNTFTGNLIVSGGCKCHAANDLAFGSTSGYTWLMAGGENGNSEIVYDGVDISEPFQLTLDSSSTVRLRSAANTRNVLRGNYKELVGRVNYGFEAGSYTVISNEVSYYDFITHSGHERAEVDIYSEINAPRVSFSAGTYRFYARHKDLSNRNYGIIMNHAAGRYVMCLPYVFAPGAESEAYEGAVLRFAAPGTFDLNGFDQSLQAFAGTAAGHVVSETPATLHVSAKLAGRNQVGGVWTDDPRQVLNATVEGAVTLSVEGPLPLDLAGVNTTSGRLVLSNGADVTLTSNGTWSNGPVSVGEGCSLTLNSTLALNDTTELEIAAGGSVTLNASVSVKSLVVDGESFSDAGTYGAVGSGVSHELAALKGDGVFVISAQFAGECVWRAAGADTSIQTAANWSHEPDLVRGLNSARFSEAGEEATVDTVAALQGILFSRPAGGAFSLAAGGGALTISGLGIVSLDEADDGVEGRHYTNDVPTTLACSQTWTFPGVESEYVQNGPLTLARASDVLSIKGKGALVLRSANPDFHGTWDFLSESSLSGMVVHVWNDQAFGASDAKVRVAVANTQINDVCNNLLHFHGDRTIANDITFSGGDSRKIKFDAGSRVVFNGALDFSGQIVRPVYGSGAEIVLAGGMKRGACWREAPPLNGRIVITNTACDVGSFSGNCGSYQPSTIDIYTSGNTFKSTAYGLEVGGNVHVNLHAPYAVSRVMVGDSMTPKINFRYGWGYAPRYDLGGFNQSCSYLLQTATDPGTTVGRAVVTSATPAQLEAYQEISQTISHLAFEGAAGLTLEGPGTLTLNGTPSPTTGSLILKGGSLVLGTTWTNATEVVLEAGSLAVTVDEAFGKRATVLKLTTGGGTLDLGGTKQFVREIQLDGVPLAPREYRAGDVVLKGLLTGAGTLRAGPVGTMLLFR
ncbi:MAG: hypothetical protein MJ240_02850 [Kiritimatiellae bacterium]|nr:hypothetical protein [Kiritimatiellia bacterium]